MKGGEITDNECSHAFQCFVYVDGKSSFIMEGGKISNPCGDFHDGVRVTRDSSFTMSGGEISAHEGPGVANAGTFTMSGGKISGNLTGGVHNTGTFNMTDGEISHSGEVPDSDIWWNWSGGGGVENHGTFTMSGGKISENKMRLRNSQPLDVSAAGGVTVRNGTFTMTGGEISDNVSDMHAGGVGLGEKGIIQVSGTPIITGNQRSDGKENNVNLKDGQYIDVIGELKDGADIGVTTPTEPTKDAPVEFTREYTAGGNNDDPARFFTSDAGYDVRLNDNREAELHIGAPGAVLTYGNDGNGTISDADVRFIGDADCDNDIDIDDVSRLYDIINGRVPTPTSDSREYVNADTDGDGEINTTDVLNIHAVLDKRMPLPNAAWTFTVNDTPNTGYFVSKVTYNSTNDLTKAVELNLPTGSGTETTTIDSITYTVSVDANGVTTVSGSSLALNDVRFEHEPKPTTTFYGDLTISKTVAGEGADQNKAFSFTVTLGDDTINGDYGEMEFTNGVAEFTLKHGESKTAIGLPDGVTYAVAEADYTADGYVTTKTGDTGTIVANATATAAFTNTKTPPPPEEPKTGDLTVSKTVAGDGADQDKEFSFTVTLSDTTINGTYGDMSFTNGVATFTLKGGESKTATGLPDGITYVVTEADYTSDGYVTTKTGDTGTIVANATATAAFTNTKNSTPPPEEPEYGSLTVKKTVTGNLANKDQYFTFTITFNAEGSYSYTGSKSGTIKSGDTVQLKHGRSITISGLPAGTTYSVTESGNDGYKVYSSGDKGMIAANATATAAFTNAKIIVPQTGDDSNLLLWLGIAGVSGLGMVLTVILGKKRKGKHIAAR